MTDERTPKVLALSQEQFHELFEKVKKREVADIDPQAWEALVFQVQNWWVYTTNLQIFDNILGEMKEIPKLPSEIPKEGDNHPLLHVEFPPEGGILTHMGGYELPYRGFPYHEFVDRMDTIKKIARNVQSGFFHAFADDGVGVSWWKRIKLLLLIPLIPSAREIFYAYAYSFFRVIERVRIMPIRYCKALRELYRAFSIEIPGESKKLKELREMIRDYECMMLEFDNAYRFRVQFLLSRMDKDALKKNPIKEINRLLDIWIEHELVIDVKNSWRLLKMFTTWYLRFDRQLLKMVVNVLLEINVNETNMTPEDLLYFEQRKDFKIPIRIQ